MKCPKCYSDNSETARFCSNCAAPLAGGQEIAVSKTMTVQKPSEAMAGSHILAGKYRIIEPIGKGGMGVVYKAEDIKLERKVALKFLPAELTEDPEAKERFIREAKAAAALSHNHICDIHEIGEEGDQLFIVMEYIQGNSLKQRMVKGPMDQAEALDIAIQIGKGLEEAHKKGIVHRDIKPGNIMVTDEGTAKVMDFGLAKVLGGSLITKEAKMMGTVAYMSPEQAQGLNVDHRTDIWSLGVVLYEMLTGQLPFKGEYEQSIIHSILNREPEPITKVRKDLTLRIERVIGKAVEKKPADRYQGMDELLGDLKAIAEGLKPLRAGAGLFRGRILGLKKIYAYAGLAGIIVVIALAGLLLFPKHGQAYDSIAVLPIQNISGDPEQEIFCDGVHQELITQLSRIKSIKKVIAKSSTMGYKNTKKKSSEIAGELRVAALVAGGANRSGNKVRINFEIIDGQTDKLIGGDQFDGEYKDILALQSEAALAIAKQIQATLMPEETKAFARKRSVNPDAYDAYLKGMSVLDGLVFTNPEGANREQYDKCLAYFDQAVKIAADFALGYSGTAMAYEYYASRFGPADELFPKAKVAALKALSLDNSLPDSLLVLADIKFTYDWDWEGGIKEFRRILELYPNHARAHAWYAMNIVCLGRIEEAIFHAERARELDPLNYATLEFIPGAYSFARQFEKAVQAGRELVAQYPKNPAAHVDLADYCLWAGHFEEAKTEHQKALDLGARDPLWPVRFLALSGEKPKAKKYLEDYLKKAKETGFYPLRIARLYSLVGDNDKAFEMIEKAFELKSVATLPRIAVALYFDNIRSDPRYAPLLRRMGLEKYWINR